MSSQQRIKLFSDWRGYKKGETIMVNKIVAHALIEQSIGIYANPKKSKVRKLEKVMKNVKGAPKDKMLKSAPVTK